MAVHTTLWEPLPGGAELGRAMLWLPLVLVPGAMALAFHRWLLRRERTGLPRRRSIRKLSRLQSWSVPVVALAVQHGGEWGSLALDVGGGAELVNTLLVMTPLLLAEHALRLMQAPTARRLRLLERDVVTNFGPAVLRLVWLVTLVLLAVTGCADLVALYPPIEVFLFGTQIGGLLGVLGLMGLMSMLLPLGFRWLLPTSAHLPPRIADALYATASRLGFSERAVLSLDTQHRYPNALMVGLIGWPRYLVLTDALMALLGVRALQGVVAHEIGHARRQHTTLLITLFGLVPAAGLYGAVLCGWLEPGGAGLWVTLGVLLPCVFVLLRPVSHRFEHEADVESARALGAEPCIDALQSLGVKLGIHGGAASWRHPSEHARVRVLRAWEADDRARAAFERRGRQLRGAVLVAAVAALAVLGWGLLGTRQLDRASQALYLGEIDVAQATWAGVDPDALPDGQRAWWRQLGDILTAASEVASAGDAPVRIDDAFCDRAWQVGLRALALGQNDEALPFLDLACRGTQPSAERRSTYMLCALVAEGGGGPPDSGTPNAVDRWIRELNIQRVRDHLAAMDPAPEIRSWLRSVGP